MNSKPCPSDNEANTPGPGLMWPRSAGLEACCRPPIAPAISPCCHSNRSWGRYLVFTTIAFCTPVCCDNRQEDAKDRNAPSGDLVITDTRHATSAHKCEATKRIEWLTGFGIKSSDEYGEVRRVVIIAATAEGALPADVAARIVAGIPDPDKQDAARSIFECAFPSPQERIDFAKALPAGKTRSKVFYGVHNHYAMKHDWDGLQTLYKEMPLGKDRTQIAKRTLQLLANEQGAEAALDYLDNLEMPEERKVAGMAFLGSTAERNARSDDLLHERIERLIEEIIPSRKRSH